MKPVLYGFQESPLTGFCILLIRYLNLDVDIKLIDKEFYLSEEFSKLSPGRKMPVLREGDFILTESAAICHYLILKSGTDKPLLGKTLIEKTLVSHRLFYVNGTLSQKMQNIVKPLYIGETKEIEEKKKDEVEKEFVYMDTFLSKNKWAAADYVTLADMSLITAAISFKEIGFNISKYKNISKWIKQCEELPGWDENIKGSQMLGTAVKGFAPNAF